VADRIGGVSRADLDKDPADVASMFDEVAERYDLVNDLLAVGQTRRWRRAVVDAVNPKAGERVLDLAAGTGTSSVPFAKAGALVIPVDFSLGMLQVGKRKHPGLPFVAGDGLALPFADGVFDAATISFGLRNLHDLQGGLAELMRVVRPGGRLVICEFSHPTWAPFRTIYSEYLMKALPAVARRTSSNPAAYVYLAESIRAWPDQRSLAAEIVNAGWTRVQWRDLNGGIVSLHRAVRPRVGQVSA
jgi:demethylmenaquinone methyltransferase/2-methoxy-6-polyprenyl-1,4-benzoquinol methylase